MALDPQPVPGSFRDPSGSVFLRDGRVYRQVNRRYQKEYEHLMGSGLYAALTQAGLLVSHDEVGLEYGVSAEAYRVLRPAEIPFISYPYEWCFGQFKRAAQLTLQVQKTALEHGMSLKDASAYNIQFRGPEPVLIDTLSFERYSEGEPWVAYRQFCQHFLAPLALMSHVDIRLSQLMRAYIDGIPLDLASRLLPAGSRLDFGLLSHLHLHARAQKQQAQPVAPARRMGMSRTAFLGLVDSLQSTVNKFEWKSQGTEWGNYYEISKYSSEALEHKKQLVGGMLDRIIPAPHSAWDLGANTGLFSRLASDRGMQTVAFDIDPGAVECDYAESVAKGESKLLPLILDLVNPSPGIGWENEERASFLKRGPVDVALALALVHHLAISNNVPLGKLGEFFARLCRFLIIEFVPKSDPQVQRLLANRQDIFDGYTQGEFEVEFGSMFSICEQTRIEGTERTLYLMMNRAQVTAEATA